MMHLLVGGLWYKDDSFKCYRFGYGWVEGSWSRIMGFEGDVFDGDDFEDDEFTDGGFKDTV